MSLKHFGHSFSPSDLRVVHSLISQAEMGTTISLWTVNKAGKTSTLIGGLSIWPREVAKVLAKIPGPWYVFDFLHVFKFDKWLSSPVPRLRTDDRCQVWEVWHGRYVFFALFLSHIARRNRPRWKRACQKSITLTDCIRSVFIHLSFMQRLGHPP